MSDAVLPPIDRLRRECVCRYEPVSGIRHWASGLPSMFVDVDVPGGPQNDCHVTVMTSSTEETSVGHVTGEGVAIDVSAEAQSLLTGCIDDVTSLRVPTSRNVTVFVCSTGTGYRLICISQIGSMGGVIAYRGRSTGDRPTDDQMLCFFSLTNLF